MRDPKLEERAAGYYDSSLPYHNFQHALDSIHASYQMLERCRLKGIVVNERVVYYALLFHDAGYHENHLERGFRTKEDYSAHIAERELTAAGVSSEIIARVKDAIIGTERNAVLPTNEDKVVRAADLSQLAADYATFKRNTKNLLLEHERLTGSRLSWKAWKDKVVPEIEFYLSQNLYLTADPGTDPEMQEFHQKARENLRCLKSDPTE